MVCDKFALYSTLINQIFETFGEAINATLKNLASNLLFRQTHEQNF